MKPLDYLDAVKAKTGVTSDYQLAKAIGLTHQGISALRTGRAGIGDETALKIASILEINPLEIIAAANVERAKSDQARAVWATLLEKISKGFWMLLLPAEARPA